jgi:valyl-tRNA synthetase
MNKLKKLIIDDSSDQIIHEIENTIKTNEKLSKVSIIASVLIRLKAVQTSKELLQKKMKHLDELKTRVDSIKENIDRWQKRLETIEPGTLDGERFENGVPSENILKHISHLTQRISELEIFKDELEKEIMNYKIFL